METDILGDRRFTVRQLAQDGKISVGSVDKILHDRLRLAKVAQWVPRLLAPFQK